MPVSGDVEGTFNGLRTQMDEKYGDAFVCGMNALAVGSTSEVIRSAAKRSLRSPQ